MSRFRLSFVLGLCLVPAVLVTQPKQARAVPIVYTFEGTGSGSLDTTSFTDAAFTASVFGDTADVAFQPSLGAYGILGLSGQIDIAGVGVASFTAPLFIFGGNGGNYVGFGNFTNGNLIAIFDSTLGLAGYDLASNFGPVTGVNANLNQFHDVDTSLGILTYTEMSRVTFSSTVNAAAVPEPSTLILFVTGAFGILGLRCRAASRDSARRLRPGAST